jgi:predicted transposase/invertase (TIGR01784 family)
MAELSNPHDRFFKEALAQQEVANDFLRYYLPAEVAALLDLTATELVKDSFVDAELQTHYSDLLYRVRLTGGRDAYVYTLFEHKSVPDELVAFQLLRYMVRIWEYGLRQRGRLWPILPIVVYHGRATWKAGADCLSLLDVPAALRSYQPDFRYWLCDLSAYDDAELRGAAFLRVALLALKYALRPELHQRLPDIGRLMWELSQQPGGLEQVATVLRYLVMGTDQITLEELRATLEETMPEVGGRLMGTIAEQLIEQGAKRGLEQGLQQGLERGEARGERKGLLDGVALGLELRWGADGLRLLPEIGPIADVYLLRAIHEGLKRASTPEELRQIYRRTN